MLGLPYVALSAHLQLTANESAASSTRSPSGPEFAVNNTNYDVTGVGCTGGDSRPIGSAYNDDFRGIR
ncbi:hypothetical protein MKUB_21690 [Mycobacterium kubicae]|uniref:Uncharacterized protein n=1 Tax=Mycobacterium kubicae TaxID=120959 RepID=A0ABQ1BLT7_9MYCO|nr:hypothetical protein MKUB_21690 [Mycobacterium kubicae]